MFKLDLHIHSVASLDGGVTEKEYEEIISKKILDVVAITDHNRIDFALKLNKKLGDSIIVGEEIMTLDGEIIGLFLSKKIEPGQSIDQTIRQIKEQKGLVYIPHPFDRLRHGIGEENLLKYARNIDIIERFNGRIIFRWQNKKAKEFAIQHKVKYAVGSDAHGINGLGKTYTLVKAKVNKNNIKKLFFEANFVEKYQPWLEYLRPKWNKIRKQVTAGLTNK